MNQPPQHAPPPGAQLTPALRKLLRPLVRLLMRRGLTFPIFAELLRELFVDVALRDLLTDEHARTDSRVSLLTGIHRKEIRRLRLVDETEHPPPAAVTVTSEIISRWSGTRAYTDRSKRPLPLPRLSQRPGQRSFETLIESVTKDVRPRAVLDELISQGIVSIDDKDRVVLNVSAFIPAQGQEAQLFYFGRNLHDHIAAASANVLGPPPARYFDRSLHYDGLTEDQVRRLEARGREDAQRLLEELNRQALAMLDSEQAESRGPAEPATRRINLGIYLYTDSGQEAAGDGAT